MARGLGAAVDRRRHELTAAGLRLVERHGSDALTFRQVAQEAGVSLGRVQHYFGRRDDLIRACFEHAQQRITERINSRFEAEGTIAPAFEVVTAVLRSLVPQTPTELAELRTAEMFRTLALNDLGLLDELRTGHRDLADFLAQQLARAQADGVVAPDVDPSRTALTLLAFAAGLGGGVLDGWLSGVMAIDLLGDQLRTIQVAS